jgi:hypothetical protein
MFRSYRAGLAGRARAINISPLRGEKPAGRTGGVDLIRPFFVRGLSMGDFKSQTESLCHYQPQILRDGVACTISRKRGS